MNRFGFFLRVCAVILALGGCTSGIKDQTEGAVSAPVATSTPNRSGGIRKVCMASNKDIF
jgi:hypothetical protein